MRIEVPDEKGQLHNILDEPRWMDKEDSDKLKKLKRRVHDLYADYRTVYKQVA